MMIWNQLGYQDCMSSLMSHMVKFYDYVFLIVLLIVVLITFVMISLYMSKYSYMYMTGSVKLEIAWSVIPSLFLVFIAVPSLRLLYLTDEVIYPFLSVKAVGQQWYWSYFYYLEYESLSDHNKTSYIVNNLMDFNSEELINMKVLMKVIDSMMNDFIKIMQVPSFDFCMFLSEKVLKLNMQNSNPSNMLQFNISFDSIIRLVDDMSMGEARLLDVDNRLVCPMNQELNMLVTSGDVLHSWSVPCLGIKVDAVPGRLNSFPLFILSSGNYYGLCSEICGVNHSFMPIAVEAISVKGFFNWASSFLFLK